MYSIKTINRKHYYVKLFKKKYIIIIKEKIKIKEKDKCNRALYRYFWKSHV